MSDSQLRELWNFDDADLGANHLGQLTEKQRKFLVGEHKSQRGVFLAVGGGIAILFCCLPLLLSGLRGVLPLLLSGGGSTNPADMIPLIAMGGFGILFFGIAVVIIGAVVAFYFMRANKKADLTVKRAEGKINYTWETKRVRTNINVQGFEDINVLMMHVGEGNKFEANTMIKDLIQEGESWTIYYTSYPFKFLSGEFVSKEK
jgi:hypothetical protein